MSKKLTFEDFENLANDRQHTLISVSNQDVPSQGTLTIKCNTCNQTFTTSAKSYKNARKAGCPNCKAKKISELWGNKPRSLTPEQYERKVAKKKHIEKAKEEKTKLFTGMQNRPDLINYLEGEANEYSRFILERIFNPPPAKADNIEVHHVIPRHAGGPDEKWNLIRLTVQDHFEAHVIRARVYNEQGDKLAIQLGSTPPFPSESKKGDGADLDSSKRFKAESKIKTGDATRKKQGTGIYAEGVSAKGGRIGGAVKSEVKDLSYQALMSDAVRKALYEGSSWVHKTGAKCKVAPEEAKTMPQLLKLLAAALPLDCKDRERLENIKNPANVTSLLAKVIKGERNSTYGWKLHN